MSTSSARAPSSPRSMGCFVANKMFRRRRRRRKGKERERRVSFCTSCAGNLHDVEAMHSARGTTEASMPKGKPNKASVIREHHCSQWSTCEQQQQQQPGQHRRQNRACALGPSQSLPALAERERGTKGERERERERCGEQREHTFNFLDWAIPPESPQHGRANCQTTRRCC